jgi:antitoxin (DNA-binding transcriptional repressor) of toxin-antitoxin stability system
LLAVADGEEIEVTRNKKVVARLVPPPMRKLRAKKPKFAERLDSLFGEKEIDGTMLSILQQDRLR